MNAPNEPLNEPVLDELLSADLDGELAAAAADLGLTLEAAREAISSPEAVARRAALSDASAIVGEPVPLDPDVAARLVATLITRGRQDDDLGAARHRRERRADTARRGPVVAGSAAAVIAGVVALAQMPSSSDSKTSLSAGPATAEKRSPGTAPATGRAFGDVSSDRALRKRVTVQLGRLNGVTAPNAPHFGGAESSVDGKARPTAAANDSYKTARRAASTCRAAAGRAAATDSPPALGGTGVANGRPVYVFVFRQGSGYDAVVVSRADCTVISRASVP